MAGWTDRAPTRTHTYPPPNLLHTHTPRHQAVMYGWQLVWRFADPRAFSAGDVRGAVLVTGGTCAWAAGWLLGLTLNQSRKETVARQGELQLHKRVVVHGCWGVWGWGPGAWHYRIAKTHTISSLPRTIHSPSRLRSIRVSRRADLPLLPPTPPPLLTYIFTQPARAQATAPQCGW